MSNYFSHIFTKFSNGHLSSGISTKNDLIYFMDNNINIDLGKITIDNSKVLQEVVVTEKKTKLKKK